MLSQILLLKLLFSTGADATSPPTQDMEVLEDFVEKLMEVRLRDMETKMKREEEKHIKEREKLEALIRDLETRLEDKLETSLGKLASTMKEEMGEFEATVSKLKTEVERKENASNCSSSSLTKSSLRDSPILLISAWRSNITSPQIVTFETFLANYNNGGADGLFNLDSGVFVCITPGYYTVSFSAYSKSTRGGTSDPDYRQSLFLYKNGSQLPESYWAFADALTMDHISVTGSRILVSITSHI